MSTTPPGIRMRKSRDKARQVEQAKAISAEILPDPDILMRRQDGTYWMWTFTGGWRRLR